MVHKLKVGFFELSSCEGCMVQILNLEDDLLKILNSLDIVACRILGIKDSGEKIDVSIVEGSVMSDKEKEELLDIRNRSRVLVALGDCACNGGRFIVKDFGFKDIDLRLPRGQEKFMADPLDKYVKVDYYVYGCPIDRQEVAELFKDILLEKKFRAKPYSVCSECILRENDCLLDKNIACLGPITRGGCKAICPTMSRGCFGCRGLAEDANIKSLIEIFEKRGIKVPDYLRLMLKEGVKV